MHSVSNPRAPRKRKIEKNFGEFTSAEKPRKLRGFAVYGFRSFGFLVSGFWFRVSRTGDRGQKTKDRGSGCAMLRMFQPSSTEFWQLETSKLETPEQDSSGLSPCVSSHAPLRSPRLCGSALKTVSPGLSPSLFTNVHKSQMAEICIARFADAPRKTHTLRTLLTMLKDCCIISVQFRQNSMYERSI